VHITGSAYDYFYAGGAMTSVPEVDAKVYKYTYLPPYNVAYPKSVKIKKYRSTFGNTKMQNPFTTERQEGETQYVKLYNRGEWTGDYLSAPLEVSFNTVSRDDAFNKARNDASSRFLKKCRSQEFDMGVFLGEYNETCLYVRDKMRPLVRAIKAYKNRRPNDVLKSLGFGARARRGIRRRAADGARSSPSLSRKAMQRDLEFKFAVMPILNDIQALAHLKIDVWPKWTIGASASETWDMSYVYNPTSYKPLTFEYNGSVKVRIIGDITISNFATYTMAEFGLTKPVATFYQVLPLSFLYEFFVPVGKWAQQFSALDGLELSNCAISWRDSDHCTCTQKQLRDWNVDYTEAKSFHTRFGRHREINFKPSVEFPTWKNTGVTAGAGQLASLVEIVLQLTKGK